MDRSGHFSSVLLGNYNLPSLAEDSEAISESEEINEVKLLHDQGVEAAKTANFDEAIQFYNEALEIDSKDVGVLQSRALTYLKQGKYDDAAQDAEAILNLNPNSSQGYFLRGLVYRKMSKHKAALDSMLTALDLGIINSDKVANLIAKTVIKYCKLPLDIARKLLDMDPYEKLSEVGIILFQSKKYKTCIKVLETAKKFQTNQKGITMQVLLTQANAHSQLLHIETALGLYQDCLTLALATHEQAYQIKCLVNLATLHLENTDNYQAVIFYEKLLHLEAELQSEVGTGEEALLDCWTKELQCGLHLNLSIAYKAIGDMESALVEAKKYMKLTQQYGLEPDKVAESFHNTGILNEILGNYQEALQCYMEYLSISTSVENTKGTAHAYGCLASIYATLGDWSLSLSHHDQFIAMATKAANCRMMILAHERKGDTLCLKEDYDSAVVHYNQMMLLSRNYDNHSNAMACCKMAAAYKSLGQLQYSLYHYNEACTLAQQFGFQSIETLAIFHVACINKDSTQESEKEEALKTFTRLIPVFEKKIVQHSEENSYCPEEYEQKLTLCYDGMQTVLSRMSNACECLQYAEAHRKRSVTSLPNFHFTCRASNHSLDSSLQIWGTDHMKKMVSEQNATILYYSLLENLLLLWVLQPGEGISRFHSKTAARGQAFPQQVYELLSELKESWSRIELYTTSESRALPLKYAKILKNLRAKKLRLNDSSSVGKESTSNTEQTTAALRGLFDLLIQPVKDILDKLDTGSHLVVVPDKQLEFCPFGALLDSTNKPLCDRYKISYLPCLLLLDRVVQNELILLSAQDDMEFQRQQARKGGLHQPINKHSEFLRMQQKSPSDKNEDSSRNAANSKQMTSQLRRVSNPRLARCMAQSTLEDKASKAKSSKESTACQSGSPPNLEKMLALHTVSTLTSWTWTDTDIASSSHGVTQFQQISDPRTTLVFGSPKIKQSVKIHDKDWMPKGELEKGLSELSMVAECLGTYPVMREEATKNELLVGLESADIVHIATWVCLQEGLLLVTPDPLTDQSDDTSHLVGISDILNLKLKAKLVVLSSSGQTPTRDNLQCTFKLASSFLSAGAVCVLVCNWSISDDALCKFLFHFYSTLHTGAFLSEALHAGIQAIRKDDRYQHVCHWAGFSLIGKDIRVSISEIRHAMLDQLIDKYESEIQMELETPVLNPDAVISKVVSKEENLTVLQKYLRTLLREHYKHPLIIPGLVELLDCAIKRLHTKETNCKLSQLSKALTSSPCALALLKWLGFHFQAQATQLTRPHIIFPHWNPDELLIPTSEALKAVTELVTSPSCVYALHEALPLLQDDISAFIDLMSITKHAPDVQLKVTDLSVRPLWHCSKTKTLMKTTGFHQVGLLLIFNMIPVHKRLLVSMLQLMLSCSCDKSPVLLYRMDVSLLGQVSDADTKSSISENLKLPTLTPLILPRNQLKMSTPWLSAIEHRHEMEEKIKLCKSTSHLREEYKGHLKRARTWHQSALLPQVNAMLDRFGYPKPASPLKVKVKSGLSASQQRIPVDEVKPLTLGEIEERREYAHFILCERVKDIEKRKRDGIIKLYLPYVHSSF